jgi:hypothetical protein
VRKTVVKWLWLGKPSRRTADRLDARLRSAVGQAEGEAAQGRVGCERNTNLLLERVEGSVTCGRIALLDADRDVDRVLVVRVPEPAKRLLGLARIAVAEPARARPDRRRGG